MLISIATHAAAAAAGWAVGNYGVPAVVAWFKKLSLKRAVAQAQKMIDAAEAQAKALAAAKAVVAGVAPAASDTEAKQPDAKA